jgi:hypothetical protein
VNAKFAQLATSAPLEQLPTSPPFAPLEIIVCKVSHQQLVVNALTDTKLVHLV